MSNLHTHIFVPLPTSHDAIDIAYVDGELKMRRAQINPCAHYCNYFVWGPWTAIRHEQIAPDVDAKDKP